jgi:hypothetical protein
MSRFMRLKRQYRTDAAFDEAMGTPLEYWSQLLSAALRCANNTIYEPPWVKASLAGGRTLPEVRDAAGRFTASCECFSRSLHGQCCRRCLCKRNSTSRRRPPKSQPS